MFTGARFLVSSDGPNIMPWPGQELEGVGLPRPIPMARDRQGRGAAHAGDRFQPSDLIRILDFEFTFVNRLQAPPRASAAAEFQDALARTFTADLTATTAFKSVVVRVVDRPDPLSMS